MCGFLGPKRPLLFCAQIKTTTQGAGPFFSVPDRAAGERALTAARSTTLLAAASAHCKNEQVAEMLRGYATVCGASGVFKMTPRRLLNPRILFIF